MAPRIHIFIETKHPSGTWQAKAADTFESLELPVTGKTVHTMEEAPCPDDTRLYGLLADEAWETLPWSYWTKGLPTDVSLEIRALSQDWEGEAYGHSYLTLQELSEKYAELQKDTRAQAKELQQPLGQVIYTLAADSHEPQSPEDRRIVFWFH